MKGIEFDPDVVNGFLNAYSDGKIISHNQSKLLRQKDEKGEQ